MPCQFFSKKIKGKVFKPRGVYFSLNYERVKLNARFSLIQVNGRLIAMILGIFSVEKGILPNGIIPFQQPLVHWMGLLVCAFLFMNLATALVLCTTTDVLAEETKPSSSSSQIIHNESTPLIIRNASYLERRQPVTVQPDSPLFKVLLISQFNGWLAIMVQSFYWTTFLYSIGVCYLGTFWPSVW